MLVIDIMIKSMLMDNLLYFQPTISLPLSFILNIFFFSWKIFD